MKFDISDAIAHCTRKTEGEVWLLENKPAKNHGVVHVHGPFVDSGQPPTCPPARSSATTCLITLLDFPPTLNKSVLLGALACGDGEYMKRLLRMLS